MWACGYEIVGAMYCLQHGQLSKVGRSSLSFELPLGFKEAEAYRKANGQYLRKNQWRDTTVRVLIDLDWKPNYNKRIIRNSDTLIFLSLCKVVLPSALLYNKISKEVERMKDKTIHLYVDSHERTLILHSLVELKNALIRQGSAIFSRKQFISEVAMTAWVIWKRQAFYNRERRHWRKADAAFT